jgi:hypothetical protein
MRHLLGGVAIAALIAAGLPAMAQTSSTDRPTSAPSATNTPQSGATMPSDTGDQPKAKKHTGKNRGAQAMTQRRGGSPQDNIAEELNRQELQRVEQGGGAQPRSGTTQGTMPQNAAPANRAPSTAAPKQ